MSAAYDGRPRSGRGRISAPRGLFSRRRARPAAAGLAAVAAVAGLMAYGARQAFPITRVPQQSGLAWVVSDQIGSLTLLDGVAGQPVVNVAVARTAGDPLSAAQVGTDGFALDQVADRMVRVDGSTYAPATAAQLPDLDGSTVRLLAGEHAVYAVDGDRGSAAAYDAKTLRRIGGTLSLGYTHANVTAVVDATDRLWVLDRDSGRLNWSTGTAIARGPRTFTPAAATLILTDGKPTVVDSAAGRAYLIGPDGSVVSTLSLGAAGTGAGASFGGGGNVYAGLEGQEALVMTDSAHDTYRLCIFRLAGCALALHAPFDADTLGPAVAVNGRVFVPDYTEGIVWVLDPTGAARALRTGPLTAPGSAFDLFDLNGLIFYNAPAGAQAGTVSPEGAVTPITKYASDTASKSPSPAASASAVAVASHTPPPSPSATPRNPGSGAPSVSASAVPTGGGPGSSPTPAPTQSGSIAVSCGQVITQNIVLTADLKCAGNGLTIAADHVTIDLDGHALSGNGTGTGVTFAARSGGVLTDPLLKNGTVSGFGTGLAIGAGGARNAAVSTVRFTDDAADGAAVQLGAAPVDGLQIGETKFVQHSGLAVETQGGAVTGRFVVTGSTFEGGGLKFVEAPQVIPEFFLTGNRFSQSSVELDGVENSTITGNEFADTGVQDMCADFGGDTISGNTFTGPGYALVVTNMANERIDGNHFRDNLVGLQLAIGDGATANEITHNDFTDETTAGILLLDGAENAPNPVTISDNTVTNSGSAPADLTDPGGDQVLGGIHVYAPKGGIVLIRNTTTSNKGYGIWSRPGTASGTGNVSTNDENGCNPITLCTYG